MHEKFWAGAYTKEARPEQPKEQRSIAYSATITSRLMEFLDSNARGNVHGGVIMRMVDESAAIVAIKHSQCSVVTARIDRMDFIAPVFVGEVVTIYSALNYVGRSSMEVGVEVYAERPRTGEVRKVVSSQLVFVALDENRKSVEVPPLVPADAEERERIAQAKTRRERIKRIEEESGERI